MNKAVSRNWDYPKSESLDKHLPRFIQIRHVIWEALLWEKHEYSSTRTKKLY